MSSPMTTRQSEQPSSSVEGSAAHNDDGLLGVSERMRARMNVLCVAAGAGVFLLVIGFLVLGLWLVARNDGLGVGQGNTTTKHK